jgi:orotidine-5'-phosphate decarboxylase
MLKNKNIMDRLFESVEKKGHVCLGLDTDLSYIPDDFSSHYISVSEKIFNFNKYIIDATIDVTAVYKPQIAYYEAFGLDGLQAYAKTLSYLHSKDAIVIADVKRGDIAKTAEMYAKAHFTGIFEADIITVNPYMGMDTLTPFFPYIIENGKGIFSLIATSNKGAMDIEGLENKNSKKVYQIVGDLISEIGKQFIGEHGYSAIGGVVGCTDTEETKLIRSAMPSTFFLIPGYGAQGGTSDDMGNYLVNGNGGVVNSSRGILLAYKKDIFSNLSFDEAARAETIRMRDDIQSALKRSK